MRRRLIEEKIIRGVKSSVSCEKDELILAESSGVMPDSIAIKGGSFQQTYEGANLFDFKNYRNKQNCIVSYDENGVVFSPNSSTPILIYYFKSFECEDNTSYRASIDCSFLNSVVDKRPNEMLIYLSNSKDNISTTNDKLISVAKLGTHSELKTVNFSFSTTTGYKYVKFNFYGNVISGDLPLDYQAVLKNIMVVKGTDYLPYEPYVGGILSPNPQYPQTIYSAENISIELKGVNLFEYADVTATYKALYTQLKATKFAVKPNTKYTIRFDYEIIENSFTRVLFSIGQGLTYYATDIEYGASLPNLTSGTFTYTFKTKNEKTTTAYPYLFFRVRRPTTETGTVTMTISNLIVVEGEEALPYEPYVEPVSIEIPSAFTLDDGSNIPLSFAEANGVKDTLIIDKVRNKVEYIQKVAKFTFNGGSFWFYNYLNPSSKVRYLCIMFSNTEPFKVNRAKGYCSHEHSSRLGTANGVSHEIWVGINHINGSLYWIGALDFLGFTSHIADRDNITTEEKTIALSQFKEWLDAQEANGNPFTVVYEIPKEQWVTYDLTSSDIGKELLKIKLPKNTAIITATGKNGVDIQGIDATYYTMNLENSDMHELIIECIDEQGNVIDAKYHLVRRDSVYKALAPKLEGYEATINEIDGVISENKKIEFIYKEIGNESV